MIRRVFIFTVLLFGLWLGALDSRAQKKWEDPKWNKWHFKVAPYFWYVGLNGTISRAPVPTLAPETYPPEWEIDVSFRDIAGSLKFALMLYGEYQGEKALAFFNITSFIIQGEAVSPLDLILQDLEARYEQVNGELFGGYRILHSHPKLDLDAVAGLKFWSSGINVKSNIIGRFPVEGAVTKGFVDPAFGLRFRYIPHPKVELATYGDYGGGIIGSKRNAQWVAGVTYRFTRLFSVMLGYRHYELTAPESDAVFRGRVYGWITRIGFQF